MFFNPSTPVINTIICYIIFIIFLLWSKPKFLFDREKNKIKSFGCGPGKTLITVPMVAIASVFGIYMVFYWLESSSRESMGDVGNIQNIGMMKVGGNIPNIPNIPVAQNPVLNMQDLMNFQNLQNMARMSNMSNIPNIPIVQNIPAPQTFNIIPNSVPQYSIPNLQGNNINGNNVAMGGIPPFNPVYGLNNN